MEDRTPHSSDNQNIRESSIGETEMGCAELTVGFDAKRAAQNTTGLGNYSRFVVEGLSRYGRLKSLNLYMPSERKTKALRGLDLMPRVKKCFPSGIWRFLPSSLWRVTTMGGQPQADGVQLFHGLSNELPMGLGSKMRKVVTIHDLIFLHYPECYKPIDRAIYNHKFRSACRRADRVVAVSECTKRDIVTHYGIDPAKVSVVYQGCAEAFWEPASESVKEEVRKAYKLPTNYVLYVGTIERRKNLGLLAQALKNLAPNVQVIAVGKQTPYATEVRQMAQELGVGNRLTMLSNVPFRHLPTLYQMASLFVYPSRFEGFGIPILEALVSGVPVIGCTGSCLEEAGGPDSIYVSPDDPGELARQIERVLSEEPLRTRMIEKGREYAQNFTAEKLTEDMLRIYQMVM